ALAFFLGGIAIRDQTGKVLGMGGFGKFPQNPFTAPPGAANPNASSNRTTPMFEFKADRLIDDDGDGIPGYIDSLGIQDNGRYYAYFFSYGSNGYDPNDVNFGIAGDAFARDYRVNYAAALARSFAPNPYTSSDPTTSTSQTVFQNPQTFQ